MYSGPSKAMALGAINMVKSHNITHANIGRAAKGLPKAAGERAAWLNSQRSAASLLRLAVERR